MCLQNCCGFVPPKTGTLILIWITVISWSIYLGSFIVGNIFGETLAPAPFLGGLLITSLPLVIGISGLYAIEMKKSMLLIPYLTYSIVCVILTCIMTITTIYYGSFVGPQIGPIPGVFDDFHDYVRNSMEYTNAYLGVVLILISTIVVDTHFAHMVYSCYQIIEKQEEEMKYNETMMKAQWNAINKNQIYLA